MISHLYLSAKIFCVIRDPISIFGAKKERFGWDVEKFAQVMLLECFWLDQCAAFKKIIRYEDMVKSPDQVLR